mgnify:CR=1 FL=1
MKFFPKTGYKSCESCNEAYERFRAPIKASKDSDERERQEREFKKKYQRFHDPSKPIERTRFEYLGLLVLQVFLATASYYYFAYYNDAPTRFLNSFYRFYEYNQSVGTSELSLLFGISFLVLLSKVFTKGTVLIGSIFGEMLIQRYYFRDYFALPQMYLFILILLVPFIFLSYKGGEFLKVRNILKEFYILILTGLVGTIFIFIMFQYQYSVQLGLVFFFSYVISVAIPLCILFAILDKKLLPYFPLTEEEMEKYKELQKQGDEFLIANPDPSFEMANRQMELQNEQENEQEGYSELDYILGIHLIHPGEYYNEMLTHHTIFKDDHTLLFMLGKVRIYLCTRCTAMILGVIISLFIFHIMERIYGLFFPDEFYLYFNIIVPALALLDWGTQKLAIRNATTKSRIITGMLIGFAMNNISKSPQLLPYHIAIVIIYFVIFFLLMIFGERRIIRY